MIVNNDFCPCELTVETACELVVVQICQPFDMIIVSVHRLPSLHVCKFTDGSIPMCVLVDFN